MGSAAVPGLEAKPITDILVGVSDLDRSPSCFDRLAELGYLYALRADPGVAAEYGALKRRLADGPSLIARPTRPKGAFIRAALERAGHA